MTPSKNNEGREVQDGIYPGPLFNWGFNEGRQSILRQVNKWNEQQKQDEPDDITPLESTGYRLGWNELKDRLNIFLDSLEKNHE